MNFVEIQLLEYRLWGSDVDGQNSNKTNGICRFSCVIIIIIIISSIISSVLRPSVRIVGNTDSEVHLLDSGAVCDAPQEG